MFCVRLKFLDAQSKSPHTSAKRLSLNREVNVDAKLFLGLFENRHHDFRAVVDGEDNVFDAGLDERLDLVQAIQVSSCYLANGQVVEFGRLTAR